MKKYKFITIIIFILFLISSCGSSLTYEFLIKNSSDKPVIIILNNSESINYTDEYYGYIFRCAYYNTIKKGTDAIIIDDSPRIVVELQPNEELSFVENNPGSALKLNEYHPLWDYQSCILEISNEDGVLDRSIWLDRHNWKLERADFGYYKYLLFID